MIETCSEAKPIIESGNTRRIFTNAYDTLRLNEQEVSS